jgi:hypothetical protein
MKMEAESSLRNVKTLILYNLNDGQSQKEQLLKLQEHTKYNIIRSYYIVTLRRVGNTYRK